MARIQVRKEPHTHQDLLVFGSPDNYTFNIKDRGIRYGKL